MARIIAFTGRAGCGKSTARDLLVENYDMVSASFAGALRLMLVPLLLVEAEGDPEIVDDYLYANKQKHIHTMGMSTREALQRVGGLFREHNPDVFVQTLDHQLKNYAKIMAQLPEEFGTDPVFVIDDLRYDNEAAYLQNHHQSTIVRIARPEEHLAKVPEHHSESGIDREFIDVVITNDADLLSYRQKILSLGEMYDLPIKGIDNSKETARVH